MLSFLSLARNPFPRPELLGSLSKPRRHDGNDIENVAKQKG